MKDNNDELFLKGVAIGAIIVTVIAIQIASEVSKKTEKLENENHTNN